MSEPQKTVIIETIPEANNSSASSIYIVYGLLAIIVFIALAYFFKTYEHYSNNSATCGSS